MIRSARSGQAPSFPLSPFSSCFFPFSMPLMYSSIFVFYDNASYFLMYHHRQAHATSDFAIPAPPNATLMAPASGSPRVRRCPRPVPLAGMMILLSETKKAVHMRAVLLFFPVFFRFRIIVINPKHHQYPHQIRSPLL